MRRAYVDANVILRLITDDPPAMAEEAARLFQMANDGEVELVIDPIVVAETVWVLSSFYGFNRWEIAPTVASLLVGNGIVCHDRINTLRAIALYETHNVDFTDAFLAVRMLADQVDDIYSFDTHFDRLRVVNRLAPGE